MKKPPAFLWQLLCAAMLLCIVLLSGAAALSGTDDDPASVSSESVPAPAQSIVEPPAPAVEPPSIRPEPDSVSITTGQSIRPDITVLPEDAESGKAESSDTESGASARELIWQSDDPAIAAVDGSGSIMGIGEGACTVTVTLAGDPSVSAEISVEVTPHADITYIDGILIANKTFSLPADYNPGIDDEAYGALNEMIAAAREEGISLWLVSGFRSYNTQAAIYNNYVARDGVAAADRYSARAGHSEHQTGLAFDLNSLDQSFGTTPEGQWLAARCWEYGFIIRYPEEKEEITGYMYEPWHVRYLGKETAQDVYESGLCLEEYLGITSVYAE